MRGNAALFVLISLLSGWGSTTMSLVAGIWILDLTASAGLAALAGLCVYAPQLAGPWLGAVLDRLPQRATMIAVNLGLAAVLLSLFTVRTAEHTWLIFVVAFTYGVSYVIIDAGETALLPRALAPARLADVNGWRTSAQEGVKLVAPLAGAGLYAWHGGPVVAAVSALMPVLVAGLYAALRLNPPGSPTHRPDGCRTGPGIRRTPYAIRLTVGLAATAIAMSGFTTAALYAVVTTDLGLPATVLGVLLSVQGAGSVLGGLVAGRLIAARGAVTIGVAGTVLFAAGCLLRCLPWPPAVFAASALIGVGLPWTVVAAVTAVQTHAPAASLGRVAATANTVMFAPIAVAIPLGAAAVQLGGRAPLVVAAIVCLAAATAVCRVPAQRRAAGRLVAPGSR
ncbi:MFS transporter [Actinoplanes sp. DH11]|uniref:MFS transporter n=1 Tax=Actinoplanes sp. DH11 TaxID=2857011 RepID=UPI001E32E793|nr:MFS transporter [Actinoplanes sp. DH11]